MKSLRARLFATTLAALALTLALTIAIGAVLTRRQVDRSQAANVASRADDLALQRRQNVNYKTQNKLSGGVRIIIEPRANFAALVPDVNRSSDGETTYLGTRQLYSYRTLPNLGLIFMRPASLRAAAWRPFLVDLLLAALVGVAVRGGDVLLRRPVDRSTDPAGRRRHAGAGGRRAPRSAPDRRIERARRARARVQPDDRTAGRVA